MKAFSLLLAVLAVSTSPAASSQDAPQPWRKGTLFFADGDRLKGDFGGMDSKAGLLDFRPSAAESGPVRFRVETAAAVSFDALPLEGRVAGFSMAVLNDGSEIPGRVVSLDSERLVLDTPAAGRLSIRRNFLSRILPNINSQNGCYFGPDGMENWIHTPKGDGTWSLDRGSLVSAGSDYGRWIFRDVGLPPESRVSITAQWRSRPSLTIKTYCGSSVDGNAEGPYIQIEGSYISFGRHGAGNSFLGNLSLPGLDDSDSVELTILSSLASRKSYLLLDGVLVHQWDDPALAKGVAGTGIAFASQGGVRVMRIATSPWDGRLPGEAPRRRSASPKPQPGVDLVNKDRLDAEIESIQDGSLRIKWAFGPLELPLERVASIDFDNQGAPPIKRKGDIRLRLHPCGSAVGEAFSATPEAVRCSSEVFGDAAFRLQWVSGIDFRPYKALYPEKPVKPVRTTW